SRFFFQAEDGIRDPLVTGVQTCALPIFAAGAAALGLGGLVTPLEAAPPPPPPTRRSGAGSNNPQFEAWLNKMTGKHKMIYDVPEIGRASCRERGQTTEAGGNVKR